MKTFQKSLLLLVLMAFTFVSCVQDLNVTPKDPNNIQYFDQNGVFTKIYATLATITSRTMASFDLYLGYCQTQQNTNILLDPPC